MGGALHLSFHIWEGRIKTKPVEASFLGHVFFNFQVCCALRSKRCQLWDTTNNTKHFKQLKNEDKNIFHTYFQNLAKNKIVTENVYFLFGDYSFVKFITTALTMYLDVKSQGASERPLVNRSD